MSALEVVAVLLLGGAAALGRFAMDGAVASRSRGELPVGTLAVNLSGAFLLGLLAGLETGGTALLLLGTATLGSFTTFSTWMFESQRLGEEGEGRLLALNLAGSLVVGLAVVALGRLIGGLL